VTRYADKWVDTELNWSQAAVNVWQPDTLARQELSVIRVEVQEVLAAITCSTRTDMHDRKQLSLALAHLRRMRSLWTALLIPGTTEPTGEHQIPAPILRQAPTYSVRDWSFARERRATRNRVQYVTVARQHKVYKDRLANRLATYYTKDIEGVLEVRGKT
jgi:hypothetical protein